MFCPQCGKAVNEGSAFCTHCGSQLHMNRSIQGPQGRHNGAGQPMAQSRGYSPNSPGGAQGHSQWGAIRHPYVMNPAAPPNGVNGSLPPINGTQVPTVANSTQVPTVTNGMQVPAAPNGTGYGAGYSAGQTNGAYGTYNSQGPYNSQGTYGYSKYPAGWVSSPGIVENFKWCFLDNFVNFEGRATRQEYWYFQLATLVITIVTAIFTLGISLYIAPMVFFLPNLAVTARRLHDTGRSTLWLLLGLTGIGSFVLLVFMCLESDSQPNEFGPLPDFRYYVPHSQRHGQNF